MPNTTPVFTWKPFNAVSVADSYKVLTTTFDSGRQQRRLKYRMPRKWKLKFKTTYAEMQEIRTFYNARSGTYESFLFPDPFNSDTNVTVHFANEALEIETEFYKNGIFEIDLEEVL